MNAKQNKSESNGSINAAVFMTRFETLETRKLFTVTTFNTVQTLAIVDVGDAIVVDASTVDGVGPSPTALVLRNGLAVAPPQPSD